VHLVGFQYKNVTLSIILILKMYTTLN
jgi:hypothetical protein